VLKCHSQVILKSHKQYSLGDLLTSVFRKNSSLGVVALLDPAAMSKTPSAAARARYWRKNLSWLGALLSVWFMVSYGCGILFVDQLDKFKLGGVPLGFWFAQQGSIYVFVVLIAVYVLVMNRLDRELLGEKFQ